VKDECNMAKILIIDDDESVRGLLAVWLAGVGHEVSQAPDGAAGLKAMKSDPADVVVCDLYMPNRDGLEAIPELRRRFPATKILAISGGSVQMSMDFLPMAEKLGADLAIQKPFNRDGFVSLITSLLPTGE